MKTERNFFKNGDELAALFTAPNRLTAEQSKWFGAEFEDDEEEYMGTKTIEVWPCDIRKNLQEWACTSDSIFYRTKKYWYVFTKQDKIVEMTRFKIGSWKRWDDWANLHSVESVGKEFLKDRLDKKVKAM